MTERARGWTGARGTRARAGLALAVTLTLAAALALALPASGSIAAAAATAAMGSDGGAHYALIVNGDDSFTHNYNVALALSSLARLGYEPRNVLVLAPAVEPAPGDAGRAVAEGAAPAAAAAWRQPATEQGLRRALAVLGQRMRPGDRLLVYLTGHGYRMFGRTVLGLQDGSIESRDLLRRLAALPFGTLVLIADQCYSGGFVKAAIALGRNVVAISSADDRHEVRCEPFIRPFWLAAVAQAGEAAGGSGGGGGAVSVEAAFRVAERGVRQASAQTAGDDPQYAASGSCAAGGNRF